MLFRSSTMKEVKDNEKTLRVHKLLELSNVLEEEYNNKFKNREVEVLIEEIKNNKSIGHTSNFLRLEIDEVLEKNKFYKVIYK